MSSLLLWSNSGFSESQYILTDVKEGPILQSLSGKNPICFHGSFVRVRETAASRCINVRKTCQFQYVICLSVENSIILSCPIQWGSKSFLKGLEIKKNTFDPLCLILAPYLCHCLGFWGTCYRTKLQNLVVSTSGTAVQISAACLYTSWDINWWSSENYFLVFFINGKKRHTKHLSLDLLGTVVSSWSIS